MKTIFVLVLSLFLLLPYGVSAGGRGHGSRGYVGHGHSYGHGGHSYRGDAGYVGYRGYRYGGYNYGGYYGGGSSSIDLGYSGDLGDNRGYSGIDFRGYTQSVVIGPHKAYFGNREYWWDGWTYIRIR
jgi:hypothetical protein